MVSQQFSPICWLACAAMVIQFKRRVTPSREMLGINFNNPWGDRNVATTSSSIAGAITRWESAGQLPFAYM